MTRQNFFYSRRLMFQYVVHCLCWRKKKLANRFRMRPHKLFLRGKEKLNEELDIVSIMKTQERTNLLTNIIMNKGQQLLFNFQRKTVLETENSEDSENLDF